MSRKKLTLITLVVSALLVLSFTAGCALNTYLGTTTPPYTPPAQGLDLNLIDEARGILYSDYVDRSKLDDTTLTRGAIKGMVDAINDPHSEYLDPDTNKLSQSSFQGKFSGIGAQVGIKDKQIIVIAPIEDTPAFRAGIKAGDIILEIDGQSAEGMSLT